MCDTVHLSVKSVIGHWNHEAGDVMTEDTDNHDAPPDMRERHTGQPRNVVFGDQGQGGTDVFFAVVRLTRMPMCLSDPNQPDNPLVFVNRAFEDLTGYMAEEVLGRNCRFLQGPDTDPAAVDEIRRAIAAKVDVSVECYNYRKDGSGFWNALYLSPVFDETGKLLHFFASQLDVTKRREAEALAQQVQHTDALGSMVASVAHEFGNMMTIVQGSLEQARRHPSSARQAEQLSRAEWGAAQAARLTQQMLNFAHRQAPVSRPADLGELVRNMDSLMEQVAGVAITLAIDAPPEPLPVLVVAGQVELALFNLVQNAADAMPGGGTLTISTRRLYRGGAGEFAVLEVADTGAGMAPAVVRRATEPFFSTKGQGKGTGLGLSMVRDCAEQSGGGLEIDSTVGQGTRIRIVLPLSAGNEAGSGTPG